MPDGGKEATPRTSYRVHFECGHEAWILAEEYGDGSAWCQRCDDFKCYDVALARFQYGDDDAD